MRVVGCCLMVDVRCFLFVVCWFGVSLARVECRFNDGRLLFVVCCLLSGRCACRLCVVFVVRSSLPDVSWLLFVVCCSLLVFYCCCFCLTLIVRCLLSIVRCALFVVRWLLVVVRCPSLFVVCCLLCVRVCCVLFCC